MRGDSGVAGEGRVVAVPKFHSWGKCTMPLRNINSDWMSNASSGLCIIWVIPCQINTKNTCSGALRTGSRASEAILCQTLNQC